MGPTRPADSPTIPANTRKRGLRVTNANIAPQPLERVNASDRASTPTDDVPRDQDDNSKRRRCARGHAHAFVATQNDLRSGAAEPASLWPRNESARGRGHAPEETRKRARLRTRDPRGGNAPPRN